MTEYRPLNADNPRRAKGYFSRRHKTAEAHIAAQRERERKEQEQDQMHRRIEVARANRSPAEQLATLDKRLGKGKGAKKERARLKAAIESAT